jgi:hypothetical protein
MQQRLPSWFFPPVWRLLVVFQGNFMGSILFIIIETPIKALMGIPTRNI